MITEDELRESIKDLSKHAPEITGFSVYDGEADLYNKGELITHGTYDEVDCWISGYLYAKRGY